MASVDKSSEPANLDDENATDATPSCLNDPNFAIICGFLQKFGGQLKIEHPDFLRLQKMIENTDEVHDELRQFFVKLLRKTRKSVQPDKLDSALAKFCYTYSDQDAWEVERFGYKQSGLAVKVRILKEILESQFDKNPNFRTTVCAQSATELRSQPLGKDRLGNAYWSTIDDQCNLRIYQEHLDDEIWKVVATNRDEMVKLIACLRGNELVMPSLLGIIDEDSSSNSNSMLPKTDALQTDAATNQNVTASNDSDDKNVPCIKIKLNPGGGESTVEQISNNDNTNGAKNPTQNQAEDAEEEEEDASNVSEIDDQSQAASESSATTVGTKSNETHASKRISLMASKPPSNANKLKLRIYPDKKSLKRNLEEDSDNMTSRAKRASIASKKSTADDDSEFGSEDLSDEELDENDMSGDDGEGDDDEVGPAIEEPTMYVQGQGSGAANECANTMLWPQCDQSDDDDENDGIGEVIEEEMFFVFGEGSGYDCDVGNNDIKTTETPASSTAVTQPPVVQSKPMFFFGQAGCLKLSPMKTATSDSQATDSLSNPESSPTIADETSNVVTATSNNDTNSVALDAKSDSTKQANTTANNDETDKGLSIATNEISTELHAPQNNIVGEKIEQNSAASNDLPSSVEKQSPDSKQIDEKDSEIVAKHQLESSSNSVLNESSSETAECKTTTTENESSKENIESNSSVALASISVQEKDEQNENEQESQPTTSSEVLAHTESHLSNDDEVNKSELSDSGQDKQSPEPAASDDVKDELNKLNELNDESERAPEVINKVNENSEIVNESNVRENENENQISLSQTNEVEQFSDVKPAPINAPISSMQKTEINEQNETPAPEVQDDSKVSEKSNDLDALEESDDAQLPAVVETSQHQTEIDRSNELDYESNSEVKTEESLSEQNNKSTIEQSVIPVETQPESETSQIIPTNRSDALPSQSEDSNQQLNDEPSVEEVAETKELPVVEKPASPATTEVNEIAEAIETTVDELRLELEPESKQAASVPEEIENVKGEIVAEISNEQEPNEPPTCVQDERESNATPISETDEQESKDNNTLEVENKPTEIEQPTEIERTTFAEASKAPQIVESEAKMPETCTISATEKRKSSDESAEPSECKKMCEEKITVETQQPINIEVNAVVEQKIEAIPSMSQNAIAVEKLFTENAEQNDTIEPNASSKVGESNEPVSACALEDASSAKNDIALDQEPAVTESAQTIAETVNIPNKIESIPAISENVVEPSIEEATEVSNDESNATRSEEIASMPSTEIETSNLNVEKESEQKISEPVAEEQPNAAKPSIEVPIVPTKEQEEIPQIEENKAAQKIEKPTASAEKSIEKTPLTTPSTESSIQTSKLRARKRRISGEKPRHSSESDDNTDALNESPLSHDASSDEEVGGKRIKMRPKVVKRSLRRSVEQKRNIKDADWSSDDNEKPNAKRATSDLLKSTENILPSPEKIVAKVVETKSTVKEELLPVEKQEVKDESEKDQAPSAGDTTKIKNEAEGEGAEERQSDEEQVPTPTRRPGRPARRGRKPGPKPKPKVTEETKTDDVKAGVKEEKVESESIGRRTRGGGGGGGAKDEKPEPKAESTPAKPETRRKKRSLLGLDMADVESIQAAADTEPPVRQSRRIAQIKIKEEAERRKAEEIALHKLKVASEKKKKGAAAKQSASEEEENSESEAKLEMKKPRKKVNKDKPWQTDSDADSSDREEEEFEHEDVERLPPLRSDHEFSPESDIEDESQIVPTKRARTARKDKTERREEESEEEEDIHACQKCSKSDHPEWILLCDKCDKGYHCSCLNPVLFVIPEGDWFCPLCQQDKLIDVLEARLIEFDTLVKQKEVEEAQRERLLLTTINEANVLKDSKRDRQRARAHELGSDESSDYSSTEDSEVGAKSREHNQDRRTRPRPKPNRQRHISESESDQSSSDNTSDNEPIYKLRKRRSANVSYRFNEYDELINRAIKSEMDEVAGAGNLGRGKDISTIIEADKEEKRLKKLEQQQKEREQTGEPNENVVDNEKEKDDDSDDQPLSKTKVDNSDDSDSEPIKPKVIKRSKNLGGKKKKKLNSLDDDSDEEVDSSDDDFNTSSYSDEEEEDDSSAASESSLESLIKKRRGKGRSVTTRRSGRERKKRYDADFIDDSSFDDEDNKPLVKKKKKVESDFSDFNDSSEEQEEDVDSEDLCDDSTDDSDRSWGKRKAKSKPAVKVSSKKSPKKKSDGAFKGKVAKKKPKISDDESEDEYGDEVLPKSRRTRGKKLPYLLDDDFDSSDDGIKPGVKRPDTPPEERAAFIKRQEEIKRMLAEKKDESDKIPPPSKDSLSTIPPQIIQSAKALDVDLKKSAILHKNASDNDSNGFDDDLPEDFDPEDMDEDAIAKMMEEEEFAQQQLKLAGETIRNRKLKDGPIESTPPPPPMPPLKKDDLASKLTIETAPSVIMPPNLPPSLVSPLPIATSQLTIPDIPPSMYSVSAQFQTINNKISTTPKKRGRKTKDDISPIAIKEPALPTIQHTSIGGASIVLPNKPNMPSAQMLNLPSVLQHAAAASQIFASPTIQHTSSVIAHSSVIQQQQQARAVPSIPTIPQLPQPSAASIALGIAQSREPIIPTTVLDVQNTRLLDPSELGKPPDDLLDPSAKKRGRRKKITPTRESLTSPPNVTVSPGVTQPSSMKIPNVSNVAKPTTSILSERLSANPVEKPGLSIATPPQLYSPSSRSQASVITRLTQRQPFPSGQTPPQRYYAPNSPIPPPHAVPSTGSHSRPYHTPNVTAASGPRQSPLVPPPHASGHLPHPMYMRGQPGIYAGYPNIQPSPMRSLQAIEHASNSPQNFTGPYQNIPFGSYYAAAAAASAERRSGAIIGTFEPFDNKNPSAHDRLPAYAHPGLGLAALAGRNPGGDGHHDDDRSAPGGVGSSEFSGLVSYFSSQQDDLDQ